MKCTFTCEPVKGMCVSNDRRARASVHYVQNNMKQLIFHLPMYSTWWLRGIN
jgi:hypothetical protein